MGYFWAKSVSKRKQCKDGGRFCSLLTISTVFLTLLKALLVAPGSSQLNSRVKEFICGACGGFFGGEGGCGAGAFFFYSP